LSFFHFQKIPVSHDPCFQPINNKDRVDTPVKKKHAKEGNEVDKDEVESGRSVMEYVHIFLYNKGRKAKKKDPEAILNSVVNNLRI
jgi:hypothetical protein